MTEQSDIHQYSIVNSGLSGFHIVEQLSAIWFTFFSNKELTRVSRKTIIAGLRQVAGEIIHGHPKIQLINFQSRRY